MKKHLPGSLLFVLFPLFAFKGFAQSFSVTYDFANVTTGSGTTDPTPVPTATGVTFGSFSAVGASANPNAAARFSFTGWPTGATDGSNTFTGSLDPARYYSVTLTPAANYTLTPTAITFTLQRSGTGIRQYAVRSSIDGYTTNLPAGISPANANLSVVSGNVFQVTDASTTAQDGSTVTLTGFTNLSNAVTFRFYGFNAEAAGGTFSLDNVKFSGSAAVNAAAPDITVTPSSLDFSAVAVNTTAGPLPYTVQGNNLVAPVMLSTATPFSLSDAANGSYSTLLSLAAADVASPKTIYVKASPATLGSFSGSITHTSTNAATKTVTLSGQSVDLNNLTFNFNSCTNLGAPGSGFTAYSDSGAQAWTCTTFGRNSTNGVNMNGYSGGPVGNSDWLISPNLSIGSQNLPVLRFWSRGEFAGPTLQLLVSTNYNGSGNPNLATWTPLTAYFPPLNNTWTLTDGIDLSAYKSSPSVYVAFKYLSSVDDGAARWTLDDIDVTDRSTYIATVPLLIGFGEASVNTVSAGNRFSVRAVGYGNITLTAPANYQLSTDSVTYSSSLTLTQANAQTGVSLFARFAPTVKALTLSGQIRITGTGLDSNTVALSATSYPKAETFDAGCYNLSFFGSNSSNNPTPQKITTQIGNISTVLKRINLDVVGVEEISSDSAFNVLLGTLPNRKAVVSNRWSYSFDPPDPGFPPQKTGFIYDSTTVQLVEARDMFVGLYDSARTGLSARLAAYPGGNPQSFWASGRLPFMATFAVTIGGFAKQIRVIDIHAKSGADVASYNRRVFDAKVLKDSLDAFYSGDNIILVGDFNDRVFGTIYGGGTISSYKPFVDDNAGYAVLTYPLDQAGRVSFVSGTGLIDHVIVSNELTPFYIANSTDIEDPRNYISNYGANTASDHLPVYARMNFSASPLPVSLMWFDARKKGTDVLVTWNTAAEANNGHFVVERSAHAVEFETVGVVAGRNGSSLQQYAFLDKQPLQGKSFYRLKQVDRDGKSTLSRTVLVSLTGPEPAISLYPNPVAGYLQIISTAPAETQYTVRIVGADGRTVIKATGTVYLLNTQLAPQVSKLAKGAYLLWMENGTERYTQQFIKQ